MKKTILSVLIILSLFIISCDENSTSPQRSEKQTIKVIDETGNPIPKVEVTFLYNNDNSYYQPTPTNSKTFLPKINKLSNAATPFKLYQNIPNPVSAITHIRFSIPRKGEINIQLNSTSSFDEIFSYKKNVEPGIYQFYIDILDSSFAKFTNDFYRLSLTLNTENGSRFIDTKDMLIISNEAQKNYITNSTGSFYFTKEDVKIGSSYIYTLPNGDLVEKIIGSPTYFKLHKEGYAPNYLSMNSDQYFYQVTLKKEGVE
ncbi:MAG: hypothetical protein CMF23_06870 [Ignavibacteriae bacterium]|nr:hypothetical protein [Ignavibacteriota bacterium]